MDFDSPPMTVTKRHLALRPGAGIIRLIFALSNINGQPDSVDTLNNSPLVFREYADTARFDITVDQSGKLYLSGSDMRAASSVQANSDSSTAWHAMVQATFPLAFAPRGLWRWHPERNQYSAEFYSDGGLFDNDPVGKLIDLAHEIEWAPGNNLYQDNQRRFLVVHTAPADAAENSLESMSPTKELNPIDLARKLVPAFVNESMESGLRGITTVNRRFEQRMVVLNRLAKLAATSSAPAGASPLSAAISALADMLVLSSDQITQLRAFLIPDLKDSDPVLYDYVTKLPAPGQETFKDYAIFFDLSFDVADKVPIKPILIVPAAGESLWEIHFSLLRATSRRLCVSSILQKARMMHSGHGRQSANDPKGSLRSKARSPAERRSAANRHRRTCTIQRIQKGFEGLSGAPESRHRQRCRRTEEGIRPCGGSGAWRARSHRKIGGWQHRRLDSRAIALSRTRATARGRYNMRPSNRETEPHSFSSNQNESHFASRRDVPASKRLLSCTVLCLITIVLCSGQNERSAAAQTPPTGLSSDTHRAGSPTLNENSTRIPVNHVFIIVLENESFKRSFGDTGGTGGDACLKGIAQQGVLLQQYYGIGHNSMDNYIAMVSGQAPNPATQQDCPVYADFAMEPKGISDLKQRFQTVEQTVNTGFGKHEFGDWAKVLNYSRTNAPTPKEQNDYEQAVGVGCVYPGQRGDARASK
jgi:hypothetical protein